MTDTRISTQQRRDARMRARGCCEYCYGQEQFAIQPFAVDHIIPRSRGGATETENLALACSGCNAHKYNKINGLDPLSNEVASLFHPRREAWRDHFVWNADFTLIIGITPTGRATVETLCMNRDGAMNLRRLLHAVGAHPPEGPAHLPPAASP